MEPKYGPLVKIHILQSLKGCPLVGFLNYKQVHWVLIDNKAYLSQPQHQSNESLSAILKPAQTDFCSRSSDNKQTSINQEG